MRGSQGTPRTYTLRRAASVVFALTAVLPLLMFAYTLYALDQLGQMQAQLGLGVALFFALIGLYIFSNLMARLSEVLRLLEEGMAAEEAGVPAQAAAAAGEAHAASPAEPVAAGAASPSPPATAGGPFAPPARPAPRPAASRGGIVVPGLGTIHSGKRPAPAGFDSIQKSMWKAEAQPHLGCRVMITVKNAAEPLAGSLVQITDDGVLLDQDGQRLAVSYLRITNIEPDRRPRA